MSVFDKAKNVVLSQLIDVIQLTDDSTDVIVTKFDAQNKEIMMGAQLTVRESQAAVFVNEGQIADVYGPGRYQLTTQNMPILTALKSWKYGFESPFKVDVYFVNTKQYPDQKWGTSSPIMLRDADFGMVRVRGYGAFSFRVHDAAKFMKEIFGTNALYRVDQITEYLRRMLVSGVSDAIAESKIPALDLAASYDELGTQTRQKLMPKFDELGLYLVNFFVENLSLPEEVEKAMDTRTSMGALGDMGKFTQYQAAQALRDAAQNEGGGSFAGMGVGMGAGVALGQAFGNAMNPNQQAAPQQGAPQAPTVTCPHCGATTQSGKFCATCGKQLVIPQKPCHKCGQMTPEDARFCSHCGADQSKPVCGNCGVEAAPGAKFCANCGNQL
ncbi:MAG: SPFH domain-containing protein [Eubacteriales bacterium]|nr:SPFH domain-containing protein [Eubacteriales bacterium]